MKLSAVKLANSVKVGMAGGTEAVFFQEKEYDMELRNSVVIQITSKRTKATVCSSLFNCIYFVPSEEVNAPDSSVGAPAEARRGRTKKAE
jgi:hypothetical protein